MNIYAYYVEKEDCQPRREYIGGNHKFFSWSGLKEDVLRHAQTYYNKGWDVVVIKGARYSFEASINATLYNDGITPSSSPNLFARMGSYKEVSTPVA